MVNNEITPIIMPPPQYGLFKEYCEAIIAFLKKVSYLDRFPKDNNAKIFFATPQRAWAKYVLPLVNGSPTAPVITVFLATAQGAKAEIMGGWNGMYETHPSDTSKVLWTFSPIIFELTFTVTYWTQLISDMDKLLYQSIIYAYPPKTYAGKLSNGAWYEIKTDGNITFEDELEPKETKDKLIRRSLTFTVPRAYLPRESIEVNKIETLNMKIETEINIDF